MNAAVRALAAWMALAAAVLQGGCGGGGGGAGNSDPQNVQAVVVDAGPADTINLLFTSVTICLPGDAARCQTIDHIQVDTGSSGLRIIGSVLNATLAGLPVQTDAAQRSLVECMQFVDGYSWGSLRVADLKMGGALVSSVPIQIIGDPAFPNVPAACANSGPAENTVASFGANGIIGVGMFLRDCGDLCAAFAGNGLYYACASATSCQPTTVPTALQVANPAALLPRDNNGVILTLPAVPATGAASVTGSLVFGVGTQPNNDLGNATVIPVDPTTGTFTTLFNGSAYPDSFIDSGSSVLFFGAALFPRCTGNAAGLYCPATPQTLSANMRGTNGILVPVSFSVGNGSTLLSANPAFTVFGNLAAPSPINTAFDWGLPFHLGRRVYTVFETRSTPAGSGPFVAF